MTINVLLATGQNTLFTDVASVAEVGVWLIITMGDAEETVHRFALNRVDYWSVATPVVLEE